MKQYKINRYAAQDEKPSFLYIMKKLYFFAFLPLYTTKQKTGKYFQFIHFNEYCENIFNFHTRSDKSISKNDKKTHCEKVFFSDFLGRQLDYTDFMQEMSKKVVDNTI